MLGRHLGAHHRRRRQAQWKPAVRPPRARNYEQHLRRDPASSQDHRQPVQLSLHPEGNRSQPPGPGQTVGIPTLDEGRRHRTPRRRRRSRS